METNNCINTVTVATSVGAKELQLVLCFLAGKSSNAHSKNTYAVLGFLRGVAADFLNVEMKADYSMNYTLKDAATIRGNQFIFLNETVVPVVIHSNITIQAIDEHGQRCVRNFFVSVIYTLTSFFTSSISIEHRHKNMKAVLRA